MKKSLIQKIEFDEVYMDSKKNDDITHNGHRARLTDLIANSGIDNVSNIQAVEYFLTYIIPRGDVNPLAHRLLDRFGNFGNIVDATVGELMQIKGINKRSAKKIRLFKELLFYYSSSKVSKKLNLDDTENFLNFVEGILRLKGTEHIAIFAFDFSYNYIDKKVLNRRMVDFAKINPIDFYDFISSTNPKHIVVAHNHPGGVAFPSQDDYVAQKFIENFLTIVNVDLIDSLIVGTNGIYSQNRRSFLRTYRQNQNIVSINGD